MDLEIKDEGEYTSVSDGEETLIAYNEEQLRRVFNHFNSKHYSILVCDCSPHEKTKVEGLTDYSPANIHNLYK